MKVRSLLLGLLGAGLCFLPHSLVLAQPQEVEVWFLSEFQTAAFEFPSVRSKHSCILAQLSTDPMHLQCITFGDFYFHPQLGVHDHKSGGQPIGGEAFTEKEEQQKKKQAKTGTDGNGEVPALADWESNLIQCDKNYYFDMFCGKSSAKAALEAPLEIWVDVSSSMSNVDPSKVQKECFRKSFVKRVKDDCPDDGVSLKTFTTSIKAISQDNYLCQEYGLNDEKRMIEWINSSNAQKLLIITDIYELVPPFSDYLFSIGATIVGDNPANKLKATDMLKRVKEMAKSCQNKKDRVAKNKN